MSRDMQDIRENRTYLNTDRVCQELRRGGTVMLRLGNGAACLFRAAELSRDRDCDELQKLAGSAALLVLTQTRMESLGRPLGDEFCSASMPVHQFTSDRMNTLAVGQPSHSALDQNLSIMAERSGSLADYATRILRVAKLVPAALVSRIPSRDTALHNRLGHDQKLMVITDREIDQYLESAAQSLRISARARVPLRVTENAEVVMFRAELGGDEHFAVIIGDVERGDTPLVRLHSQCITGDVLGSLKCDCGDQLQGALQMMADHGNGILVYLAQEGRDIGLLNKMRAYALQDNGLDTVDANHALGFETDERYFKPACRMLEELGITSVRLITNNPDKIAQLEQHGVAVTERVPMALAENKHNERYLQTKRDRTGHLSSES